MRTVMVIRGLLVLLYAVALAAQQNGNDLFQQGLAKERVAGDCDGAIQIYEHVVRDFASDKPLAAKALIQLGGCYEKLGLSQAQNAYEQVINKYRDQFEMADKARERLAAWAKLEIGRAHV